MIRVRVGGLTGARLRSYTFDMQSVDVVFDQDGTPIVDAAPYARALDDSTDWRPPPLPYRVPARLRLPLESKVGAPSVYGGCTEDLCRRVEQLVINGSSVAAAKTLVGLTRTRWNEWKRAAEQHREPYSIFMERVRLAQAHVEATCTTTIHSAAVHPDPKVAVPAAVKALEMQFPRAYAPKRTIDHKISASVNVNVNVLQAVLSADPSKLAALVGNLVRDDEEAVPMLPDHGKHIPAELFDQDAQSSRPPRPGLASGEDDDDEG